MKQMQKLKKNESSRKSQHTVNIRIYDKIKYSKSTFNFINVITCYILSIQAICFVMGDS